MAAQHRSHPPIDHNHSLQQTLFPNEGAACVARVFEEAYHDVAPLALEGGATRAAAAAPATVPSQGSKLPPPIGRIPAAASMRSPETAGGLGAAPLVPPPTGGLVEILVEPLGMRASYAGGVRGGGGGGGD